MTSSKSQPHEPPSLNPLYRLNPIIRKWGGENKQTKNLFFCRIMCTEVFYEIYALDNAVFSDTIFHQSFILKALNAKE